MWCVIKYGGSFVNVDRSPHISTKGPLIGKEVVTVKGKQYYVIERRRRPSYKVIP